MSEQDEIVIPGYRVIERLGSGATSEVMLGVEDKRRRGGPGEKVVLKVLSVQVGDDTSRLSRFKREIDAYGSLSHDVLVRLREAIITDERVVLVLEYVDGTSLQKLLELLGRGERLPNGVVLYVMERLFAALAVAHARTPAPLVHGEMRASNLLLGWDGQVKLAEFGITKMLHSTISRTALPRSPFSFVAPEEARGGEPTTASDVFAASLIAWELFSGRPPPQRHGRSQEEIATALTHSSHPSLDVLRPDLPQAIRRLFDRGLARNPADRTLTAADVVEVLATLPLERGKERLSAVLARWRPESGEPPKKASSVPEHEAAAAAVLPAVQAAAFRALSSPGMPARRNSLPRAARRMDPSMSVDAPARGADTAPGSGGSSGTGSLGNLDTFPSTDSAPSTNSLSGTDSAPSIDSSPSTADRAATPPEIATGAVAVLDSKSPASIPLEPRTSGQDPLRETSGTAHRSRSWIWALAAAVPVIVIVWARCGSAPVEPASTSPHGPPTALTATPVVAPGSASALVARPEVVPRPDASSASTAPTTTASSKPPPPPSTMGDLRVGRSGTEHRVFVDGVVVGEGPGTFRIKCGMRRVRVGSNGEERELAIPCRAELAIP